MARYDIHFDPISAPNGARVFSFKYVGAVAVTGPRKMMNRWMKCLFTPKGSDPMDLNYGTMYASLFQSNISSAEDVRDVVALAIQDCNEQMVAMDGANLPDLDERFGGADITAFTAVPDGFSVTVRLSNAALASAVIDVPVQTLRV